VPSQVELWLILLVVALSGLVATMGLNRSIRQVPNPIAESGYSLGPRSREALVWWLLVLAVWGIAALAAAVVGWGGRPGEVRALVLAAMLAAVVSCLVVTSLFIGPVVASQHGLAAGRTTTAVNLYRRWQGRRTILEVIAFLAAIVALAFATGVRPPQN